MPKEITHWAVAQKAAAHASEPHVRRIIENNMGLYLTGAVAVDSPYYAFTGGKKLFKSAGARLHGMGEENPFSAVLRVPAVARGEGGDQALAFTLGALTHLIADTVFHPMVYYLTGDYDDPDKARRKKAVTLHRLLETRMDVWFAKSVKLANGGSLLRSAAKAWTGAKAFTQLASSLFFGKDDMTAPARMAVASHAVIQSFFKRRWAGRLAGFYGCLARRDMGEFTALFYPPMTSAAPPFFSEPIRYKNPVSGEFFRESLADMEKRAVETCAGWFDSIAKNPDSTRLMETCSHLSGKVPPGGFKPVHFAPEREMDELLKTLSVFRTAR
jgi:hypothetical protein